MASICLFKPLLQKTCLAITFLLTICLTTVFQSFAYTDHSELISSYEGSKTCRTCHEEAVESIIESSHYRLMGHTQDVYDMFTNKPVEGLYGKGNRY